MTVESLPLRGRQDELAVIEDRLREVSAGTGGVIVIEAVRGSALAASSVNQSLIGSPRSCANPLNPPSQNPKVGSSFPSPASQPVVHRRSVNALTEVPEC
jgi:hypothetical protein